MKIITERESFLSNYEVLQHMHSIKEAQHWTFASNEDHKYKNKRRGTDAGLELEAITRDTLAYFEATKCTATMEEPNFVSLSQYLNQFELVKVEKLQILNSLPRSMVHLYALVEECGVRFDEATCDSIVQKIDELFPRIEGEEEEEEKEEEEHQEPENADVDMG